MTSHTQWQGDIVPAQLSYLAIYNPSLGPTDETFEQQLVFYYSRASSETKAQRAHDKEKKSNELKNEQLRQIGLAQGLVDFARTFSNGEPVDSVETDKARIILHQLESGWWLLASIDLTRLPSAVSTSSSKAQSNAPQYEYSSREVGPPKLLVQQIKQAQHVFCLHHGPSLSQLCAKLPRDRFCNILERFWTRFAKTWDVMLHGNPAVDALAGIKLASGGELGFGVGEEEWGSGERAVLEEFTRHTEGLVDTVVARFGEPSSKSDVHVPWIGAGDRPAVADGVIFGGINGITRQSLQSVSLWMRHIYTYGEYAYGVRDNPSRERRKRRRRNMSEQIIGPALRRNRSSSRSVVKQVEAQQDSRPRTQDRVASQDYALGVPEATPNHPGIPPPIVSAAEAALTAATRKAEKASKESEAETTMGIPDQYLKYLTLGLSTFAKPSPKQPPLSRASTSSSKTLVSGDKKPQDLALLDPMPDGDALQAKIAHQRRQEEHGYFIIGLKGDLNAVPDNDEAELTEGSLHDETDGARTVLRTIHVSTTSKPRDDNDSDRTLNATSDSSPARIRVLIYARRPFLYCFLFEQRTSSLSYGGFYKDIHRNLRPIHKALLTSTAPNGVAERIGTSQRSEDGETAQDVHALLYDPIRLTVHATVPNISEPGTFAAEGLSGKKKLSWTRLDALNVHSTILNALCAHSSDVERTSKTTRGWWVVWMRLSASDGSLGMADGKRIDPQSRIAIVVRKADEKQQHRPSASSGMWSSLAMISRSEDTAGESLGLNAGGIGFDARRYVEGLLSLNR